MNTSANSDDYILPADSLRAHQLAVYFESDWLWKEKDPICRANASRRLAELSAKLAELEAAEAKQFSEQNLPNEAA
ncbi:MAG: hypothetical protein KME27_14540 [Lyngbya sp. HA4199-MV5]|jgi:hypothetical protein|nr:hypothetical protein [Lyngbya sp. HA4199-MV5]